MNPLYIRNSAYITIVNHSNYIGTPFGPNPKATWRAVLNKASGACVPSKVQDTINLAEGWFETNTPGTPGSDPGVKPKIGATGCYVPGSCGTQKDWVKVLDDYNNGSYPGGPSHCGDE